MTDGPVLAARTARYPHQCHGHGAASLRTHADECTKWISPGQPFIQLEVGPLGEISRYSISCAVAEFGAEAIAKLEREPADA